MSDVLKKLTREMEKVQEPKRFVHTQGVEYTAAALAMRYGEDVERAQVAGLLHDCAKCMGNDKLLSACEKHHIPVTDVERRNPYLLHAKVGSYLAKKEYKVEDPEILSAILYHTTGHPNMTLLEKIIFTADYIEPGRKQAPNLKIIRQMAFIDLDAAVKKILEDTLDYLRSGDGEMDPMTEETYQYYKNYNENKKSELKFTYELDAPLKDKIEAIATKIYGAGSVTYSAEASRMLKKIEKMGYGHLPVCMAKNQYSLSDDPNALGRPEGFNVNIREVYVSAGAGFVVAITGTVMTMPGLPKVPAAENIDVVDDKIVGLF